MKQQDWNTRYASADLVWGSEPNRFVAEHLAGVPPGPQGRALDLACGEGRNSIWLASQGWRVTGVDFSDVAIERARKLAESQGVDVDWIVADVTAYAPDVAAYDLVLISYLQVPAADRQRVLANVAAALAPGGQLFLIAHALRNIDDGWAGPSSPDVLWDPPETRREIEAAGLQVASCAEVLRPVETDEGTRNAIDTLARATRPASA
jgi:2-polyprenyl-3-methyl-5-hydroxy-6-metoxy-1,4-benzoquinol methylase